MPVPWIQIVRLMPSILEVSRELLKRTRRATSGDMPSLPAPAGTTLEGRIAALEENERRQAELVTSMAEQLAQLTVAVTALHRQMRWLIAGQVVSVVIVVAAIAYVIRS